MIETIFKLTNEIALKVFKGKSFERTDKLIMKYSILADFNQGVVNFCNSNLFKKYEEEYVPAVVSSNKYDSETKSHSEESLNLIYNLIAFLNNKIADNKNNKVFALFGDSGSGKSLATQKIIDYLWHEFATVNHPMFNNGLGFDENSWFSFYIDMAMFNGDISENFIEVALHKQYTLSYQQIIYLKNNCRCLIILDHFELARNIVNPALNYSSILQEWHKSKFFIATRSDILGVEEFNKYFCDLQYKNDCIVHFFLNKLSAVLSCKKVIDHWFEANYHYIKDCLNAYNLFFNCNLAFKTYNETFNSFINYMMQVAFYAYLDGKTIISLYEINCLQDDCVLQSGLFWKLFLINYQFNVIDIFPVLNKQNYAYKQCFFSINYENKDYFIKMQKTFINYFVAMCLWSDLINNRLEQFISRLRYRNLTEEMGIISCLVDFFDKLQNSEKNNLQTLIRTALISVDKTIDVNLFVGLNAILQEFDLINNSDLMVTSEQPNTDDYPQKTVLFSYKTESSAPVESQFKQQNKVNLICNAHGFSLLCFELYSLTRKAMITYYVKLSEEQAKIVLEKNSPTVKDFKKADIINLFQGTADNVPSERKIKINNLFTNKSKLLFD